MYEVVIHPGPEAELVEVPVPKAGPDQLVIRVVVSGSNPKDWKMPEWTKLVINQGDDIAASCTTSARIGEAEKTYLQIGDRVAAFHEMGEPGGSYGEYAIAWEYTTFHLPEKTSFEEGSTIPLAALTAALGLFRSLALPTPFAPAEESIPMVIYGGSSAVGAFAIKLARRANIHPLLVVAGAGSSYAESLIDHSKGDRIIDHRLGTEHVFEELNRAEPIKYALDTISVETSYTTIARIIDPNEGRFAAVLPYDEKVFPPSVITKMIRVDTVHERPENPLGVVDFGFVFIKSEQIF